MSLTNAQKTKRQKIKSRERKVKKARVLRKLVKPARYRLDVFYKDEWVQGVRTIRTSERVQEHITKTNEDKRGGLPIAQAKIVDTLAGTIVWEIESSGTDVKSVALGDGSKKAKSFKQEGPMTLSNVL